MSDDVFNARLEGTKLIVETADGIEEYDSFGFAKTSEIGITVTRTLRAVHNEYTIRIKPCFSQ